MARKGIRIKDLARELGVTSRALIDRCRAAGIPAQNRITKLPPELERIVRGWFAGVEEGDREADLYEKHCEHGASAN